MHDLFLRYMKDLSASPKRTAMLLSGGIDSGSVLCAAMESGLPVLSVVSASFGEYPSPDALAAQARHKAIGCKYHFRFFNTDRKNISKKVTELIEYIGGPVKTAIEVSLLMKPLLHNLAASGCKRVLNGMNADNLWGMSKRCNITFQEEGLVGWNYIRLTDLTWDQAYYPPTATRVCRQICRDLGMEWCDPYESIPVVSYLMNADHKLLHPDGHQKGLAVKSFPLLSKSVVLKSPLQISSGIRDFMDIYAKGLGYTSAQAYYNHEARGLGFARFGNRKMLLKWAEKVDTDYVISMIELSRNLMTSKKMEETIEEEFLPDGVWAWKVLQGD